ncbi:heme A synthase [Phycisphaerales bacterium AB-hyl4]|uniref:Heme A synthase n=1 Tax=Natronomicrosphaera hydrolytica TaxID=3242702 RepID=A0ABV4U2T1_9BACT
MMSDPALPVVGEPGVAAGLQYRPWLHRYAMLLVLCVFLLIGVGGTVTSTGAGMAVPDWPTTFGHNMITAPPSVWFHQPDRFWEHFHRLMGTLVGMLTIGMAVWLTITQRKQRRWLVALGWGLLGMVIVQGLMGGFRVTEESIGLAVLHGIFGQIVFAACVLIAAATSRVWIDAVTGPRAYGREDEPGKVFGMRYVAALLLVALVIQLMLGAWMRHNSAGLAIPDFPTAYGQLLPPLHASGLEATMDQWQVDQGIDLPRPYTTAQVSFHLAHRAGAVVVCAIALLLVVWVNLVAPGHRLLAWPTRGLVLLLTLQVALGAYVIWSRRHVDIATAHQACGALVLAVATLLTIRLNLLRYVGVVSKGQAKPSPEERNDEGPDRDTEASGASPAAQPSA